MANFTLVKGASLAEIDSKVTNAQAAQAGAEAARDAAQDAVQYDYFVDDDTALAALTGMTEGQRAYVRATEHVWAYVSSAWADTGKSPVATKTDKSDVTSGNGSDLVLCDQRGFVAARLGASGARAKTWSVAEDKLSGGGVVIEASDEHGLIVADGRGFFVRFPTVSELRGEIDGIIAAFDLPQPATVTDGAGLWSVRGLLAGAVLGVSGTIAKIGWIGDSYTQYGHITNALADLLYARYGQGGSGLMGAGSVQTKPGGAAHWYTDCVLHDITAERGAPTGYYGPSGMWLEATGTVETIRWTTVRCSEMRLYYHDGDGTFRYQIDSSGTWVTVAGGSTGNPAKVVITGLDPDVTHRIDIDMAGNTGTVRIAEFYATGMDGVELSCIGNASGTAKDMAERVDCAMRDYVLADIALDAAVIQFGGNDVGQGDDPATVYTPAIEALIADLVAVNANCGVILAATQELSPASFPGLRAYTDACKAISATTDNCEWIDMWALFGPWAAAKDMLFEGDEVHPNAVGGRVWAGHVFNNFFLI